MISPVVGNFGFLVPDKDLWLKIHYDESERKISIHPDTEFDAGLFYVVISNYNIIKGRYLAQDLQTIQTTFNRIPAEDPNKLEEYFNDMAINVRFLFLHVAECLGISNVHVKSIRDDYYGIKRND